MIFLELSYIRLTKKRDRLITARKIRAKGRYAIDMQ